MIAPPKPDLVTVNIDGKEIAVPKGTNVIEAARLVGVDVPHYCYHPKLSIVGNCRMCLVEMGMPAVDPATKAPIIDPATGKQKINWIPRPQIGCGTNASPGLHIRTTSQLVKDCREGVMEFLLINHPLDCPICDQAGECKLQEQATGYGRGYSRYIEQKNVKPKRTQLGPRVTLDDERCILCSRCIRFCKEIVKDDVLGFIDRGSYSTLTCYPGKPLVNNYSLCTVDLCPVGALTSSDFRFKMRVWFLKQTNSIDTESSVGANTIVWSREGVIYRITPRTNNEVNDDWMADSGRVLYKQVNSPDRLLAPKVNGAEATADAAFAAAAEIFRSAGPARAAGDGSPAAEVGRGVPAEPKAAAHRDGSPSPSPTALVVSGRSSVEEQFLAKKLAAALGASVHLVSYVGAGDGILISADRTPNLRGALVTGLIDQLHAGAATNASGSAGILPAGSTGAGGTQPSPEAPAGKLPALPDGPYHGHPGPASPAGLHALGAAIDAGQVKAVISLGEDLLAAGVTADQLAKVQVVYLGTHANATTAAARVVIPTRTVFEKNGTFINQQFRIQKFQRAIPGPVGAIDDVVALARLATTAAVAGLAGAGAGSTTPAPTEINPLWKLIAAEVPALGTMSYGNIPWNGLLLDGTPWNDQPFVEGASLHFKGPSRADNPQASKPATPDNT